MSKRFTDTQKYKNPFFRGLQGAYKLLWDYLYHECDHAGIWIKDFEIAQIYIGNDMLVNEKDALNFFNNDKERIIPFDNNKKWFIPSFIEWQYQVVSIKKLNPENKVHNSVINILKKNNLFKGLERSMQGSKDKDKDKDKVKEKLKEIHIHKYNNIMIDVLLNDYGVEKVLEMITRFDIYQKEFIQRGWDTQYRLSKRWNKFVENISKFVTQEALNREFEDIAKRNNKPKKPLSRQHIGNQQKDTIEYMKKIREE